MSTLIIIGLLFGVYKVGDALAKNPDAAASVGKVLKWIFLK